MRKLGAAEARESWEVERERLVREGRTLRSKLEVAGEVNQRLLSEKNALQVILWCWRWGGW